MAAMISTQEGGNVQLFLLRRLRVDARNLEGALGLCLLVVARCGSLGGRRTLAHRSGNIQAVLGRRVDSWLIRVVSAAGALASGTAGRCCATGADTRATGRERVASVASSKPAAMTVTRISSPSASSMTLPKMMLASGWAASRTSCEEL